MFNVCFFFNKDNTYFLHVLFPRRIYWTNWNQTHPAIERVYASGRGRQALVTRDILMPNGLALEHEARLLYWADARLDKLERMRYDGSHRRVVTRARSEHPFAVAAGGGWVAWTDWLARGVFAAERGGGAVRALRTDVPRPCAVVLVAPHQQTCTTHARFITETQNKSNPLHRVCQFHDNLYIK